MKNLEVIKAKQIDVGTCDKVWHLVDLDGKDQYILVDNILDWWEITDDGKWIGMGGR